MENDEDCQCCKKGVREMLNDRRTVLMLIGSLFVGVFCGYILGWYFSPQQATLVKQTTNENGQVQASPSPAVEKFKDISVSDSGELLISTPRPGDTITTPLKVNGLARGFENRVGMRLKNQDGIVVRETKFTAKQGEIGTFISLGVDMIFAQPTVPGDGTFEAFTFSAKDGSEINKITLPIKFAPHGGSGL